MVNYKEIRDDLKTGDLVAFSGSGLFSKLIKAKTKSKISHVGIIIETKTIGPLGRMIQYCESTSTAKTLDVINKKYQTGVQMHLLSQAINNYNGEIWVAPLKKKLEIDKEYKMQTWLRKTHSEEREYDLLQAIGAGCDVIDKLFHIENAKDLQSLFCSELVTKALQEAGVVSNDVNPSEMTPADVVNFGCHDYLIPINKAE